MTLMSPPRKVDWEPTRNRLLAALVASDRDELLRDLEPVGLESRQVLCAQGEPIGQVYFLLDGMCSLVVLMRDGRTAEASVVGNEGFVGVGVLLGIQRSPVEVVCQAPGSALQMSPESFRWHTSNHSTVRASFLGYAAVLLAQTERNAACNRLHDVEPRLARWLLMTSDRLGTSEFPLSQDLLMTMLGVQRATVSEAAEALQAHGFIRYHRGNLAITDSVGLKAAACECYAAIQAVQVSLLGA